MNQQIKNQRKKNIKTKYQKQMSEFKNSKGQQKFFDAVMDGKNVFLTGKAGSGNLVIPFKSLQEAEEYIKTTVLERIQKDKKVGTYDMKLAEKYSFDIPKKYVDQFFKEKEATYQKYIDDHQKKIDDYQETIDGFKSHKDLTRKK